MTALSREGSFIQHTPGGVFSHPGNPLQGVSVLAVKRLRAANRSKAGDCGGGGSGPIVLPLSTRQDPMEQEMEMLKYVITILTPLHLPPPSAIKDVLTIKQACPA